MAMQQQAVTTGLPLAMWVRAPTAWISMCAACMTTGIAANGGYLWYVRTGYAGYHYDYVTGDVRPVVRVLKTDIGL